jgi:hypothetical protein
MDWGKNISAMLYAFFFIVIEKSWDMQAPLYMRT